MSCVSAFGYNINICRRIVKRKISSSFLLLRNQQQQLPVLRRQFSSSSSSSSSCTSSILKNQSLDVVLKSPDIERDSVEITATLLQQVKDGNVSIENAVVQLRQIAKSPNSSNGSHSSSTLSLSSLDTVGLTSSFMNIDHDRYERTKFPEAIFAQGKTPNQVAIILDEMAERRIQRQRQQQQQLKVESNGNKTTQQQNFTPPILATRVTPEMNDSIGNYIFQYGRIKYFPLARIICMQVSPISPSCLNQPEVNTTKQKKHVVVATAGTTDITVAEEAAVTLEASGIVVDRIFDVGVAGLHRIINALPKLTHPNVGCIIVCAGMDGALPSVVGGLVSVPVIAVPTSVGYGAAFQGVSALLTMLNSCAPGVGVVNIDNGFGAAALAYKCLQNATTEQ